MMLKEITMGASVLGKGPCKEHPMSYVAHSSAHIEILLRAVLHTTQALDNRRGTERGSRS